MGNLFIIYLFWNGKIVSPGIFQLQKNFCMSMGSLWSSSQSIEKQKISVANLYLHLSFQILQRALCAQLVYLFILFEKSIRLLFCPWPFTSLCPMALIWYFPLAIDLCRSQPVLFPWRLGGNRLDWERENC